MTNAEIIAKIRAEIERLKNTDGVCRNNNETADIYYARGARFTCEALLSFLSDLEKSLPTKVTDGDELEIEIERVVAEYSEKVQGTRVMKPSGVEKIARRFYDLGCRRTAEKYDEIEYNRQRAEESIPNDLEEAAREYAFNNAEDGGEVFPRHLGFIAGAKWQHERDWRLIEAAHKHGFDAGSNWQKEQMLREAVEGRVISNEGISFPVSNEIHRLKLMEGDKVRITIVKED